MLSDRRINPRQNLLLVEQIEPADMSAAVWICSGRARHVAGRESPG
jgi:hypothetical protein